MKFFKTWLIWKLCFLMAFPINVWSQALPVAQPDRVGRAVSGVLQDGMRTRGFAANDPRFGNTLARISPQLSGVAGTAAAVTVGAVTAPGWVSVALAITIGAVITFAVNLALDSLIKWLFRTDSLIDESSSGLNPADIPGTSVGSPVWCTNQGAGGGCASSGEAMGRQAAQDLVTASGSTYAGLQSISCAATSATAMSCVPKFTLKTNGSVVTGPTIYLNQQTGSVVCPGGSFYRSGACRPLTFDAAGNLTQGLTPQTAVGRISSQDMDKQLNPAIVAGLANSAWQRAASQPGYDGLPYPQSNPITSTEVSNWTNANPQYTPMVRDFVSPNPTTTASPQPWALPSNPTATTTSPATTPNANTTNPASANPLQNLGPDPATGAPQLEPTPTAQQILQPILSLLPNLRNFSATSHAGACPKPSFSVVGKSITMDAHCTLIDNNKAVMQAAMAFAWAAIALFIILSA